MNTLTHDKPTNEASGWEPCAPGEFTAMARRMTGRRQKVFAAQLTGGAVFGILLGLAVVTFTGLREREFAGITCADVLKHVDAYIADRLDPELKRQIDTHLAECPACGPRFRQIIEDRKAQQPVRTVTVVDERRHLPTSHATFRRTLASAH